MLIQESYYPTFGEKKVFIRLDNEITGYWSVELANEMILQVKKNNFFNKIAKEKVIDLIEKRIILPIYSDETLFEIIKNKIMFDEIARDINGMYTGKYINKIFIFVNDMSDVFGHIDKRSLYAIICHELMHYIAANKWHSFFRDAVVKKVAITWYASFLKQYFKLESAPSLKLGKHWFYEISRFENKRSKAQSKITAAKRKIVPIIEKSVKKFSKLPEKTINQRIDVFWKLGHITQEVGRGFDEDINWDSFHNLIKNCYYSYVKILGESTKYVNTTPGQEFFVPSEIIAISFSYTPNQGNRIISLL